MEAQQAQQAQHSQEVPNHHISDPRLDHTAELLREYLGSKGCMTEWPKDSWYACRPGYPPHDIQDYCVTNTLWQVCRKSMKGIPTHETLAVLKRWYADRNGNDSYMTECQVGNYLGALVRGGQLDHMRRIRKFI